MGHGDAGSNVRSTAVPNQRPVTLAEAILVARGPFPSSEVRRVTTPAGELGVYRVNLRQRDEINQHHPFTTVWVDRWSGQIRDVRNPHRFSPGQTFTVWLWPLHTGEAFAPAAGFCGSAPVWPLPCCSFPAYCIGCIGTAGSRTAISIGRRWPAKSGAKQQTPPRKPEQSGPCSGRGYKPGVAKRREKC